MGTSLDRCCTNQREKHAALNDRSAQFVNAQDESSDQDDAMSASQMVEVLRRSSQQANTKPLRVSATSSSIPAPTKKRPSLQEELAEVDPPLVMGGPGSPMMGVASNPPPSAKQTVSPEKFNLTDGEASDGAHVRTRTADSSLEPLHRMDWASGQPSEPLSAELGAPFARPPRRSRELTSTTAAPVARPVRASKPPVQAATPVPAENSASDFEF
eukprot:gnl/TRDRNA2_/TRDRNA2_27649_c0_seq1.p1 gnl/TRDRNA2_/TRDRNA2_27649_c0~~gnl/TRDRNA2_/TRDRNA2_27649_c0_seq1.p1  ORF type:complete len:214 (-),score=36.86 gnl/TRDRNA2_/TRDRNA2_27649_c0_seq1:207-848(-)